MDLHSAARLPKLFSESLCVCRYTFKQRQPTLNIRLNHPESGKTCLDPDLSSQIRPYPDQKHRSEFQPCLPDGSDGVYTIGTQQWFGSGSALIWLSWIRIQEQGNLPKLTNEPGFQPFKKVFVLPTQLCFMTYYLH